MHNYSSHDLNVIPPGHEKVSDDLLIYSLTNWKSPPETPAGRGVDFDNRAVLVSGISAGILVTSILLLH